MEEKKKFCFIASQNLIRRHGRCGVGEETVKQPVKPKFLAFPSSSPVIAKKSSRIVFPSVSPSALIYLMQNSIKSWLFPLPRLMGAWKHVIKLIIIFLLMKHFSLNALSILLFSKRRRSSLFPQQLSLRFYSRSCCCLRRRFLHESLRRLLLEEY